MASSRKAPCRELAAAEMAIVFESFLVGEFFLESSAGGLVLSNLTL
jgi:hypothetical protein